MDMIPMGDFDYLPQLTFGFYKLHTNATMPKYATEHSACFDLFAHLMDSRGVARAIQMVSDVNMLHMEYPTQVETGMQICIPGGYTALIPTGLVAQIPSNYSLRIHLRSSVALKRGLYLPNGEGIIDSDYYDELFMLVRNASKAYVPILHNERICQGEWISTMKIPISEIHSRPQQTTDRSGGFGSTGA